MKKIILLHSAVAVPVLSEGDVLGCVLFLGEGSGEVELKLAQMAAGFLGRHMES